MATEDLGRRLPPVRTGELRQFLHVCKGCADARLGHGDFSPEGREKTKQMVKMVEEAFKPSEAPTNRLTRSDSFVQGHQKTTEPEYYQPSLFDE
jgi:hypothetical protein